MSSQLHAHPFTSCPHCGAALHVRYRDIADLYDIVDERFDVCDCPTCHLAFTNPQPRENLQLLYPDTYLTQNTSATMVKESLLQRAEVWYRRDQSRFDFELLRQVTGLKPADIESYCDLGCGTGDRVAFVHQAGSPRTLGVDPFDFFTALANKSEHFLQSELLIFKPDKKFQIVSLFHVLEHVPEPDKVLEHIADQVLQPGGYLLIQVPNYGGVERKVFGRRWSALDIPRHFWHFRDEYLQERLSSMGYSVLQVYQRNAALHPVTTAASLWRDLHIQRIWVKAAQKPSLYWTLIKMLWMLMTLLTIPWNVLQNLMNSASMLTIIVRAPLSGMRAKEKQRVDARKSSGN